MGQNTTVLGVVAVIVLIVVLMSPTLIAAGQNFLNKLWEGWQSFFNQITDAGGQGKASIGAILHYEDGTSETLNGSKGVPLTVIYGGEAKLLKSIDFQLYGAFIYSGTITSINVDATIEFDFNRDGTPEKTNKKTGSVPNPTGAGNIYAPILVSLTISSSELEQWAGTQSGEYTTQVRGRGKVTVTFADGNVSELHTTEDATGTFTFDITVMGAKALKAYIGVTPLY